jgi:transposase InsO family protein
MPEDRRAGHKTASASKLSGFERERLPATVNSPEHRDLSPAQIVPMLADQGSYVASESTIYRVLREEGQATHRAVARPPRHEAPRAFEATGPRQVWSWDITYMRSPIAGRYFHLYLVIDVWSRNIVGTAVHDDESAEHASLLIRKACTDEGIDGSGPVLHSDNGAPMKGSTMLATLQLLGIVASSSRPRVSDDNP